MVRKLHTEVQQVHDPLAGRGWQLGATKLAHGDVLWSNSKSKPGYVSDGSTTSTPPKESQNRHPCTPITSTTQTGLPFNILTADTANELLRLRIQSDIPDSTAIYRHMRLSDGTGNTAPIYAACRGAGPFQDLTDLAFLHHHLNLEHPVQLASDTTTATFTITWQPRTESEILPGDR